MAYQRGLAAWFCSVAVVFGLCGAASGGCACRSCAAVWRRVVQPLYITRPPSLHRPPLCGSQALNRTATPWVIVLIHRPLFGSFHRDELDKQAKLSTDIMNDTRVPFVNLRCFATSVFWCLRLHHHLAPPPTVAPFLCVQQLALEWHGRFVEREVDLVLMAHVHCYERLCVVENEVSWLGTSLGPRLRKEALRLRWV